MPVRMRNGASSVVELGDHVELGPQALGRTGRWRRSGGASGRSARSTRGRGRGPPAPSRRGGLPPSDQSEWVWQSPRSADRMAVLAAGLASPSSLARYSDRPAGRRLGDHLGSGWRRFRPVPAACRWPAGAAGPPGPGRSRRLRLCGRPSPGRWGAGPLELKRDLAQRPDRVDGMCRRVLGHGVTLSSCRCCKHRPAMRQGARSAVGGQVRRPHCRCWQTQRVSAAGPPDPGGDVVTRPCTGTESRRSRPRPAGRRAARWSGSHRCTGHR